MRRYLRLVPIAVAVAAWLAPLSARAQDVRYTAMTKAEFGGALGRMMRFVGASKTIKEVTSLKGARMRTDQDDGSTIIDASDRRFTILDHKAKTYYTLSFEQMTERAEAAMEEVEDSVQQAEEQAAAGAPEEPNVKYEFRFAADRTGKHATLAGYDAEQVFFTVEIEAIPIRQPEETEEEAAQRAGTLVFLSELWLSTEFPGYKAMQEHQKAWAEAFGAEMPSKDLAQAYAFDPRMRQGMERLTEEMKGVEGTPLRSVTHVVSVPGGMTFDREAVLRDANKGLSSDVAGAAAAGVQGAVSGVTRGLLGRRRPAAPPKPKVQQATIMRLTEEVTDCSTASLADDLFKPPAGYTERKEM